MEMTGLLGSTLSLLAMMLVGITLFTGLSWFHVMDVIGQGTLALFAWIGDSMAGMRDWFAGRRAKAHREVVRKVDTERRRSKPKPRIEPQIVAEKEPKSKRVVKEQQQVLFANLPADSLPQLDLLDEPPEQKFGLQPRSP